MPMLSVLTSTNTGFTFQFVDMDNGTAEVPTATAGTTLSIDFVTAVQSL